MTTIKNTLLFLVLGAILSLTACDDNSLGKLRERELDLLDKYIKDNNITVKPTASGLYYIEVQKGTGDTIKVGDVVDIYYRTYRLSDSTLVDYNITANGHYYDPLRFTVTPPNGSSVVEGLNEGVKFMQLGTIAHMIIPSQIAYGQNGAGVGIPAFSTLLFEIRIHKVIKGSN
jgi:FKBP-type peptidyl-prolyl cis-trans isomerase FkpA